MPPYSPYLNPQQTMNNPTSYEMEMQRKIELMQNQLQQAQAQRQMMAQQAAATMPAMNQTMVQPQGIVTQIVENFDNISANAVPMDNNGAIFIKNDGSEIQARRWSNDGRIQITSYKPLLDPNNSNTDTSSQTAEKSNLGLSDDATGLFIQKFDEITNRLDAIEQIWNDNHQTKNVAKPKKEADTE